MILVLVAGEAWAMATLVRMVVWWMRTMVRTAVAAATVEVLEVRSLPELRLVFGSFQSYLYRPPSTLRRH